MKQGTSKKSSLTVGTGKIPVFGFIVHPLSNVHLRTVHDAANGKSGLVRRSISRVAYRGRQPQKILETTFEFEAQSAKCVGILCPLTPKEIVVDQEKAMKLVLKSIELAASSGAKLVGLGGFTSIIGSGGMEIAKRAPVPVTSGNTYTVCLIVDGISKMSRLLGIDMKSSTIAIIGATGDIGSACARKLISRCKSVRLVGRKEDRLQALEHELRSHNPVIEKRPGVAARESEIVITATSAHTTLIERDDLKPGAIVCDASYPANVAPELRRLRPDVLIFEGGMATWPLIEEHLPKASMFWRFNPIRAAHGCFAETLLLALENKFVTYSIGRGNILEEKLEEIRQIASKYGFECAEPTCGGTAYSLKEVSRIRESRNLILGRN